MKNIHVIPTDKPSRLVKFFTNKFHLCKEILPIQDEEQYQNIYITNDEEIKEGDYVINNLDKLIGKSIRELNSGEIKDREYSKIILTTDHQLIQDGVQAIDDEFLEWFVKNPTCEELEVGYGWIRLTETDNKGYWVSIPDKQFEMQQEEPKQECCQDVSVFYLGTTCNKCNRPFRSVIEEPKQETLEEAAETISDFIKRESKSANESVGIVKGVKWQQERRYSEEEVFNICREFAIFVQQKRPSYKKQLEWFEQFKK
jgi:hypothetical protein